MPLMKSHRASPFGEPSGTSNSLWLRGGDGRHGCGDERMDDKDEGEEPVDETMANKDADVEVPEHRPRANANLSSSEFQPGSIVRIEVTNFVTYNHATFYPGPKLNMVIGPNGTGKSSFVCAICLGLGYPAGVLGRAGSFSEFVKHGTEQALIEIELQKGPKDPGNHVVRLRINHEDNSRKFWINGKESTQKAVQKLVQSLRIQVDNLCQFLPQDKVAEFAGLNSVDLLSKTLQAAAPPSMRKWQEELKDHFSRQKEGRRLVQAIAEELEKNESRQQILQTDVEKLRERQEIMAQVGILEKAVVLAEYQALRGEYRNGKEAIKTAEKELARLQNESAPALQAVRHKEDYAGLLETAVDTRKSALINAERIADQASSKVKTLRGNLQELVEESKREETRMRQKRQELQLLKTKMNILEAQHRNAPAPFDAAHWNGKIREQEHRQRELRAELDEKVEEMRSLRDQGTSKQEEQDRIKQQQQALNSKEGALLHHLEKTYPQVAQGWKWLDKNKDQFEKEVFGPAALHCSVKDPRYSNLIQATLNKNDLLCFTAQTSADHKKLSERFYKEMRLSVEVRTVSATLFTFASPLPKHTIQDLGLDDYALSYLDGPDPVRAMLCVYGRLHTTAIGLNDISEEQFDRLRSADAISTFAAAGQCFRVVRRKEYGPEATTTRTSTVHQGNLWTDQPVDSAEREALKRRLTEVTGDFLAIRGLLQTKKQEFDDLNSLKEDVEENIHGLRQTKGELQKVFTKWQSLPLQIESDKEVEKRLVKSLNDIREGRGRLETEQDETQLQIAQAALDHQQTVWDIRVAYRDLLQARIRHAEAKSDVDALTAKNADIHARLESFKQALQNLHDRVRKIKQKAQEKRGEVDTIEWEHEQEHHEVMKIGTERSPEDIKTDLESERARLHLIHANNPHAIEEFQKRADEIEKLKKRKDAVQSDLELIDQYISRLRDRFEPQLDELIGKINDAFGYNFEQINCAGEVGVHKDEDFEKWAIEIKVKFRESEILQRLDQHRQSGGERAVSTIFYLMSLQSMAQAPFRVVDEINQGMDPRNERMVHERMVQIACREHSSQYFLITPKLLPNLHFDQGVKVHVIASGTQMPADGAKRVDFAAMADTNRKLLARVRAVMMGAA